jgi:hypothetical protein
MGILVWVAKVVGVGVDAGASAGQLTVRLRSFLIVRL